MSEKLKMFAERFQLVLSNPRAINWEFYECLDSTKRNIFKGLWIVYYKRLQPFLSKLLFYTVTAACIV